MSNTSNTADAGAFKSEDVQPTAQTSESTSGLRGFVENLYSAPQAPQNGSIDSNKSISDTSAYSQNQLGRSFAGSSFTSASTVIPGIRSTDSGSLVNPAKVDVDGSIIFDASQPLSSNRAEQATSQNGAKHAGGDQAGTKQPGDNTPSVQNSDQSKGSTAAPSDKPEDKAKSASGAADLADAQKLMKENKFVSPTVGAMVMMNKNDFGSAVKLLNMARTEDKNDPYKSRQDDWLLAESYRALKQPDKAIEQSQKGLDGLEKVPGFKTSSEYLLLGATLHQSMGYAYYEKGDMKSAAKEFGPATNMFRDGEKQLTKDGLDFTPNASTYAGLLDTYTDALKRSGPAGQTTPALIKGLQQESARVSKMYGIQRPQ